MKRYLSILFFIILINYNVYGSVYNTISNPPPTALGAPFIVWNAETPTPGNGGNSASQQIALFYKGNSTPISVDGRFSAAPGVFEVDVQLAAVDNDTDYQTCSNCNITTVDATNFSFHLDGTQINAKFVRLLMRSRTNSVTITARITQ